jgi:HSP20 family protein
MATQTTATNEQKNQPTQEHQMTRRAQRGDMARGMGYRPFSLALSPADVFRLNPFSLMRKMTEEMDHMFGEIASGGGAAWAPAIEVVERDGKYIARAELPGVKPEDVKLEVTDEAIVIQGERKVEHEETKDGVHLTECRYGQFLRSIPLPDGAKIDEARAKFENGILEVTVPLQEQQSKRREIPIEASTASAAPGSGKAA